MGTSGLRKIVTAAVQKQGQAKATERPPEDGKEEGHFFGLHSRHIKQEKGSVVKNSRGDEPGSAKANRLRKHSGSESDVQVSLAAALFSVKGTAAWNI